MNIYSAGYVCLLSLMIVYEINEKDVTDINWTFNFFGQYDLTDYIDFVGIK